MTGCDNEHPESAPHHHDQPGHPGGTGGHGHGVHVWLITSGFPALSAHVLVRPPAGCHQVRRELEHLLCERFALDHTTLQVDHAPDDLLTAGGGTR
jgi:cobalt-zinc-cadmium efflux system protein